MPKSCVVRVFATTQNPDYDSPWQTHPPVSGTGSGVVVGPGRVLTGAHVVANGTFIRVQNNAQPDKFVASVLGVCHDCDLALLEVSDPRFMSNLKPATMGGLPALGDKVAVIGFPVGGEEMSVTQGVVSRVELQRYSHSERRLLAVTVDAAINSGNSGGPVFLDGHVVGIAFQSLEGAENIGEMVPATLLERFIAGVKTGQPLEIPGYGLRTQSLENPALRKSLTMTGDQSGVLVRDVVFESSADGQVEAGDVLLEIDGYRIANNGTVQYRQRYRTGFEVTLGDHFVGDTVSLAVLRAGKRIELSIKLSRSRRLVANRRYDCRPTYFVYAGLVFQPVSVDFLSTWTKWYDLAPKEFLYYHYLGVPTAQRREVVALAQVLADELNVGYEDLHSEAVTEINGHAPRDMQDFVARVQASTDIVHIRTSSGSTVVLDVRAAEAANARVLKRYHVPADRSTDL